MKLEQEFCDLCRVDVSSPQYDGFVYRRFKSWWVWRCKETDREDVTICGDCWDKLSRELWDAREAAA